MSPALQAWGGIRPGPGNALPTDYTFTGQKLDAQLGLMYYVARWYDPQVGRFLSADSIVPEPGGAQSLNRYTYVANNPVRHKDSTGHWVETAWDIANIVWDVYEVKHDPSFWNIAGLVVDVGAVVLPAVPAGAGLFARGGEAAKVAVGVASHADEVADVAKAASKAEDVRHAVTSATVAQSKIDSILPELFDARSRFGKALYVAQEGETAVAEVAAHGGKASHVIRFRLDLSKAKV